MKTVATLLYEITPEEIKQLPIGYQILQHNRTTDHRVIIQKDGSELPSSRCYAYYLFTNPPVNFCGISKKRAKA